MMLRSDFQKLAACTLILLGPAAPALAAPEPSQLVAQMDQTLRGNSHDMTVAMDVKTARWERHYEIRVRMKDVDYAFARVLAPAKAEGQGFLRVKERLWQYLPAAERTILIPPSLMLDDFMGSDFSNDDFVKLSYFPRDYEAEIASEETLGGFEAYRLTLLPRPDAPVTYGKLEIWLRKDDSAPLRWVFYDEKMKRIRTLHYSEFKPFGTHVVPTVWHMENHRDPDRETTIRILEAQYDIAIPEDLFTRDQLEKYP